MFRKLPCSFAALFLLCPVAVVSSDKTPPAGQPRRGYVKYSYQVILPDAMLNALKEHSPAFRIFGLEDYDGDFRKSAPLTFSSTACYSAVFTDINGDNRDDAVLFGEADLWIEHRSVKGTVKEEYFSTLAVLSEGTTGYRVVQVSRGIAHRPVKKGLTVLAAGTAVDDWYRTTVAVEEGDLAWFMAEGVHIFRWRGRDAIPEFEVLPPLTSYQRKGK
ncbi:MAG: hypothetical protein RDU13_04015 [Elusimicrobiales bacterium]|nr:hypothetical protein [Elusimicrobiales bacterium]